VRRSFLVVPLVCGPMVMAFLAAAPAGAVTPAATSSQAAVTQLSLADPEPWVVSSPTSTMSNTYVLELPEGYALRAADGAAITTGPVSVLDGAGQVVGNFDEPFGIAADGSLIHATYAISGTAITETISAVDETAYPVSVSPSYLGADEGDPAPPRPGAGGTFGDAAYVSVPSNYVYKPSLGSLHDYCTDSPDEFPSPVGANASFRGPCARHDLCYGGGKISKFTCDNRLWSDMIVNCKHWYSWIDPNRQLCGRAAAVYWAAVVVAS